MVVALVTFEIFVSQNPHAANRLKKMFGAGLGNIFGAHRTQKLAEAALTSLIIVAENLGHSESREEGHARSRRSNYQTDQGYSGELKCS